LIIRRAKEKFVDHASPRDHAAITSTTFTEPSALVTTNTKMSKIPSDKKTAKDTLTPIANRSLTRELSEGLKI
jgi:hypothetical protein